MRRPLVSVTLSVLAQAASPVLSWSIASVTIDMGDWGAAVGLEGWAHWRHADRLTTIQHIVSVFFIFYMDDFSPFHVLRSFSLIPLFSPFGPAGTGGEIWWGTVQTIPGVMRVA